jgi:hypothetical protein
VPLGPDQCVGLEKLLSNGYFPKEYPPPFNTVAFAAHVAVEGLQLTKAARQRTLTTQSAVHNLARPGGSRRRLHIPNPLSQFSVTKILVDNWKEVDRHCEKADFSVSRPLPDLTGRRALKPAVEGSDLALARVRVRSGARFILRADIARFYGSLYTHSLPWALNGKLAAKASRRGGFANDLDEALRNCQDGQTLGIPVGPDTSFVVSEIVASSIDNELIAKGLHGFRFVDDYEFAFNTRAAAEIALATIEEILANYELALNLRKTTIDQLPIELERPWIDELRHTPIALFDQPGLLRYFNRAFELKQRYPHDPVIAYSVARLRPVPKLTSWDVLTNILCQCALVEPGAIEPVVTLLQENRNEGSECAIDTVIRAILEHHTPLSYGSELVWALWAAIWFNRKIPSELAKNLDGNTDPAVALLALYAREKGLIRRNLRYTRWTQLLTSENLYGPMWLLTYEADLKGWLTPRVKGIVKNDVNFGPLYSAGVSFFDESVAAPTKTLLGRPSRFSHYG